MEEKYPFRKLKRERFPLFPSLILRCPKLLKKIEIRKEVKKDREIYQTVKKEKIEDDDNALEEGEVILLHGARSSESPEKQPNENDKKRLASPESEKESDGDDIILLHGRRRLYSSDNDDSSSQKPQLTKRVVRLKDSKLFPSVKKSKLYPSLSINESRQFSERKEIHELSERKRNVSEEEKSLAEMVAKRRSTSFAGPGPTRAPIYYIDEDEEDEDKETFSTKRSPIFFSDELPKRDVPFSTRISPTFYDNEPDSPVKRNITINKSKKCRGDFATLTINVKR